MLSVLVHIVILRNHSKKCLEYLLINISSDISLRFYGCSKEVFVSLYPIHMYLQRYFQKGYTIYPGQLHPLVGKATPLVPKGVALFKPCLSLLKRRNYIKHLSPLAQQLSCFKTISSYLLTTAPIQCITFLPTGEIFLPNRERHPHVPYKGT